MLSCLLEHLFYRAFCYCYRAFLNCYRAFLICIEPFWTLMLSCLFILLSSLLKCYRAFWYVIEPFWTFMYRAFLLCYRAFLNFIVPFCTVIVPFWILPWLFALLSCLFYHLCGAFLDCFHAFSIHSSSLFTNLLAFFFPSICRWQIRMISWKPQWENDSTEKLFGMTISMTLEISTMHLKEYLKI